MDNNSKHVLRTICKTISFAIISLFTICEAHPVYRFYEWYRFLVFRKQPDRIIRQKIDSHAMLYIILSHFTKSIIS